MMRIIKTTSLILACLSLTLIGCGRSARTTGFMNQPEVRGTVPPELPSRIAVVHLSGDVRVTRLAQNMLEDELYLMGFDVVRYVEFEAALVELGLLPRDLTKSVARTVLAREFNIEGLFVGEITSRTGLSNVRTHLDIKLIMIDAGQSLWKCETDDPRWFVFGVDEKESAAHTVRKAMKMLRKDLKKLAKKAEKEGEIPVQVDEAPPVTLPPELPPAEETPVEQEQPEQAPTEDEKTEEEPTESEPPEQ